MAVENKVPADAVPEQSREQLEEWADEQRRLYWLGRLSPDRVEKLESLPDWDWGSPPTSTETGAKI